MADNTESMTAPLLNTSDKYPEKIKMSGLPFVLQGWNSEFVRSDQQSDGCPIYYLESYVLYFVFPIIGATIMRVNGRWVFHSEGDFPGIYAFAKKGGCFMCDSTPDEFPYGKWTYGATVSPVVEEGEN